MTSAGKRGFWTRSVRGQHYFCCRKRCHKSLLLSLRSPWKKQMNHQRDAKQIEQSRSSGRSKSQQQKPNGHEKPKCKEEKHHLDMWIEEIYVVLGCYPERAAKILVSHGHGQDMKVFGDWIWPMCHLFLGDALLMWARADWACRRPRASTLFCDNQDAETWTYHPPPMPGMFKWAWASNEGWKTDCGAQQRQQLLLLSPRGALGVVSKQVSVKKYGPSPMRTAQPLSKAM